MVFECAVCIQFSHNWVGRASDILWASPFHFYPYWILVHGLVGSKCFLSTGIHGIVFWSIPTKSLLKCWNLANAIINFCFFNSSLPAPTLNFSFLCLIMSVESRNLSSKVHRTFISHPEPLVLVAAACYGEVNILNCHFNEVSISRSPCNTVMAMCQTQESTAKICYFWNGCCYLWDIRHSLQLDHVVSLHHATKVDSQ